MWSEMLKPSHTYLLKMQLIYSLSNLFTRRFVFQHNGELNTFGISLQLLLHLFLFSFFLHTIHSVLNTSVKVSGGGHHYLPRKTSLLS